MKNVVTFFGIGLALWAAPGARAATASSLPAPTVISTGACLSSLKTQVCTSVFHEGGGRIELEVRTARGSVRVASDAKYPAVDSTNLRQALSKIAKEGLNPMQVTHAFGIVTSDIGFAAENPLEKSSEEIANDLAQFLAGRA